MTVNRGIRMGIRVKRDLVDGPSLRSAVCFKRARSHSCN